MLTNKTVLIFIEFIFLAGLNSWGADHCLASQTLFRSNWSATYVCYLEFLLMCWYRSWPRCPYNPLTCLSIQSFDVVDIHIWCIPTGDSGEVFFHVDEINSRYSDCAGFSVICSSFIELVSDGVTHRFHFVGSTSNLGLVKSKYQWDLPSSKAHDTSACRSSWHLCTFEAICAEFGASSSTALLWAIVPLWFPFFFLQPEMFKWRYRLWHRFSLSSLGCQNWFDAQQCCLLRGPPCRYFAASALEYTPYSTVQCDSEAGVYLLNMLYSDRPQLAIEQFFDISSISGGPDHNSPGPVCLPFTLASCAARARAREWMTWGFLMTKPSLTSFLMFWPAAIHSSYPKEYQNSDLIKMVKPIVKHHCSTLYKNFELQRQSFALFTVSLNSSIPSKVFWLIIIYN